MFFALPSKVRLGRFRVDEATLATGTVCENFLRKRSERSAQPARLRGGKSHLVGPRQHSRRKKIGERLAEDHLRAALVDEVSRLQREHQLDEPIVEKRQASLDRVRHRVAILVPEQLR